VCVCIDIHVRLVTPGLGVHITCMVHEFTCGRVYVYIYAHRVCKWYICVHICKPRLHVFVYISTYIHTETACLRVYIYTYLHQVYRCGYAEFTWVCVCIDIHYVGVYMFT